MSTAVSLRFQTGAAFVAALAAFCVAAPAQGPYEQKPAPRPAVVLSTGVTPDSPWKIETSPADYKIRITHREHPSLAMEIDADDQQRDNHYEGITLIVNGKRLEGTLYGSKVSFLSPDHDAGPTERVEVLAMKPALRVRFEGGSYERLQPAGDRAPVFLEAVFTVNAKHQLEARLNGIYYILPTRKNTTLTFHHLGGTAQRTATTASPVSMEYFEAVTQVDVNDSVFGAFLLKTFIQRLQFELHPADKGDVFELDLDHTYKDRGQKAVLGLLRFEKPLD